MQGITGRKLETRARAAHQMDAAACQRDTRPYLPTRGEMLVLVIQDLHRALLQVSPFSPAHPSGHLKFRSQQSAPCWQSVLKGRALFQAKEPHSTALARRCHFPCQLCLVFPALTGPSFGCFGWPCFPPLAGRGPGHVAYLLSRYVGEGGELEQRPGVEVGQGIGERFLDIQGGAEVRGGERGDFWGKWGCWVFCELPPSSVAT